jgi:hypothetical protein
VLRERALVALLYRADWTRLSLSADVARPSGGGPDYWTGGSSAPGWARRPPRAEPGGPHEDPGPGAGARRVTSRLLIAPGGRYRVRGVGEEDGAADWGCDGDRPWRQFGPLAEGEEVRLFGGPEPPFPELLCPSWLLSGFELELEGTAIAGGREGLRVVARQRRGIRGSPASAAAVPGRAEVIVDAELGILLRCQRIVQGQAPWVEELREVRLDPPEAADQTQFAPPPGSTVGESPGAAFTGSGWRAAKTAAGLGAAGLDFAFRHAPRRPSQPPADAEGAMPHDEPDAASASPPGPGQPVSDELIFLLYRGGAAVQDVAAELHLWRDPGALMEQARSAEESAGIPGPGLGHLADTLAGQLPIMHQVARIRFAATGRYRIDYLFRGPRHKPASIACDGQRRWRVYRDRVTVGPAAPPPREIADLLDPSWLLQCRLSGGAEVIVRGRRGFRITAAPSPDGPRPPAIMGFSAAEAAADAELGILLHLTSYAGGRPAIRFEVRDITRPGPQDPADFRIDAAPGVPIVEDSGSPLDEVDVPESVKRAVKAARDAAHYAGAGVTAVTSFLDSLRGKNSGTPPR